MVDRSGAVIFVGSPTSKLSREQARLRKWHLWWLLITQRVYTDPGTTRPRKLKVAELVRLLGPHGPSRETIRRAVARINTLNRQLAAEQGDE